MGTPLDGQSTDSNVPGVNGVNNAAGFGVEGTSDTGIGVFGRCNKGHAIKGLQGTTGNGSGFTPNPNLGAGVHGESDFGYGVYGSSEHQGVKGENRSGAFGFLGGSDPGNNEHAGAYGQSDKQGVMGMTTSPGGTGVFGGGLATANGSQIGVRGESITGVGVQGHCFGSGLAGRFLGDVEITGKLNGGQIHCNGNLTMSSSGDVILSDFAEHFDFADVEIEPGTVVAIDGNGTLRPSNESYDKKVAGVVSGAGNFRPAIILGANEQRDQRMPIALVGKVFCKVDANYCPVEIGDLLTTSDTLGHAMKAEDPLKAFGSVIGKALRRLETGQGLIPILVALQ